VESGLKQSIRGVVEETNKLVNNMENVAANEANLEAKIEKKRVELERNQEPHPATIFCAFLSSFWHLKEACSESIIHQTC
jgi:clusterin-associated protein 1